MTQHFDFVALGWVEKYLREEMDTARSHLYAYQREPSEIRHLREALRNVHSATGVLRLCALDPAALLTQEIERVIGQLIVGKIAGEARKLAMTELAAGIEALPAYLANVRAKREVSAGVIANVINDLRHFGNRPSLPDSLFFNPSIKPNAGVTQGKQPAEDAKLRQFGARAMRICAQHSKTALKRDRNSLKQLYAVGKHGALLLAGSPMEAYFRCYMGFIEALAQPYTKGDEVVVDILKNSFAFLKSLALTGSDALNDANPMPYVKKMLYYIAKTPAPTAVQKNLREVFNVHNVDDVGIASAGRLIQEDDLLEALKDTMNLLLSVMEFMTSQHRDIYSGNSVLVNSVVPKLHQVFLQLKALGLTTHAETISEQHAILKKLSEASEPAAQADLLDFGGALVAVKENLEHKLKHGLSAEGDSMGHDLDAAIMAQTFRCLGDMKNSIKREFARQDLLQIISDQDDSGPVTKLQLRPVQRATALVEDEGIHERIVAWEQGDLPARNEYVSLAEKLLELIPENAYAEQAAADMEQVVSVLSLMEDKQREAQILKLCIAFIRDSMEQGGLVNDAGMACFAESIAALEQFMERRTEDPLGNADDHLDRGEIRARMLDSFIEQRKASSSAAGNVVQFESPRGSPPTPGEAALGESPEAPGEFEEPAEPVEDSDFGIDIEAEAVPAGVSMELGEPEPEAEAVKAAIAAVPEESAPRLSPAPADGSGVYWRDALRSWLEEEIERGPDAPPENPDADIDEELVECFVEEARKYIRKLQDASPQFADDLENEKFILDIRAVFHTMKGSARTIELYEFGELMYDMEKVFNSIRDGYIKATPDIAELLKAVTERLPGLNELLLQRVPLYTSDFSIPHQIAAAISEKRFDAETMQVALGEAPGDVEAVGEAMGEAVGEAMGEAMGEPVPPSPDVEQGDEGEAGAEGQTAGEAEPATAATLAWDHGSPEEIAEALAGRLDVFGSEAGENSVVPTAQILLRAVVPILKQLSDSGILSMNDAGLSQLLQLPAIASAAENPELGTVRLHNGAPVACQLTDVGVEGLKRYQMTITPEGSGAIDPDAHVEVEQFLRRALDLPAPADPIGVGSESAEDHDELEDIELQAEPYSAQRAGVVSVDLENIPVTEPPPTEPDIFEEHLLEGDPLSPKPDGASEPDHLGSEGALSEDFFSELDAVEELDAGSAAGPVNFLDLDEDLDELIGGESLQPASEAVPGLEQQRDDLAGSGDSEIDESTLEELTLDLSKGSLAGVEEVSSEEIGGIEELEIVEEPEIEPTVTIEELAGVEEVATADVELDSYDQAFAPAPPGADSRAAAEPDLDAEPGAIAESPTQADGDSSSAAGEQADPEQGPQPNIIEFPAADIDMDLLEIFIESLDDAMETVDEAAASLFGGDENSVQRLKNTLHTLKGGANSIGLRNYGTLVHELESRIGDLEYAGSLTEAEGQSEVYAQIDLLHEASEYVKRNQVDWNTAALQVSDETPGEAPAGNAKRQGQPQKPEEGQGSAVSAVASIRVPTNRIDRLLDVGLEVSMSNVRARRALDNAHQDRQSVQALARRVEEIVDRLSLQLDTEIQAKTELMPAGETFDPLELDRLTEKQGLAAILREAAFDLHEEAKAMGNHVSNAMRESVASARLIEGSQSDLRLLRLVSFSRLGPGFRRLVHQVSRQLGKDVDFDLTCDDGGLDVGVFEKVRTALEHMLRNAVDHGVELPEEREAKGKSPTGKVSLIIYRQAAEFVIRLMDDGKGIAPETLRKKAVERGILGEDERISEHEALQLIFHAGLSTADKVTDISGRGVGMDVVQQSIAQIGGTIDISSKAGFYTQFDVRVPASIMVNGALLAAIGEEQVAIPLTSLDGSDFRGRDEIYQTVKDRSQRLLFRNEEYELRYLGTVRGTLPTPALESMPDFVPVLFARYGRRRVAFFADSVTNAEELVIRSLGAQFTGVPGIAGGSLKSDGQPVLALDLNELIRQVDYSDSLQAVTEDQDDSRILVLCVDDSVMMRRTYEKRLVSLDYEVVTAEDGEAALDYLAEAKRLPDFVFTDLEMPNMNGFDFIQNMRRIPSMETVPVVVVSSRDGEKHRSEARKVGATDFMAKGSNSAEGMQAMIQRYLDAPAMAS